MKPQRAECGNRRFLQNLPVLAPMGSFNARDASLLLWVAHGRKGSWGGTKEQEDRLSPDLVASMAALSGHSPQRRALGFVRLILLDFLSHLPHACARHASRVRLGSTQFEQSGWR